MRSTCLLFLIFLVCQHTLTAQGCSDAGICSLDNIRPAYADKDAAFDQQIRIAAFYGNADNSISVWGTSLEYTRKLSDKFSLDGKLTTLSQSGNQISAFGVGDFFLAGNYATGDKLTLTLGAKIPLQSANRAENNLPLPMDYQSSLGTFDLLVGASYKLQKFQMSLAWQQPLSQNKNAFVAENHLADSPLRKFSTTNRFVRSGDILFRVSYPIRLSQRWHITPGVLPIYHLANDKYTDASGNSREIDGSKGLTLNGNVFLDYDFNEASALQFNVGLPFVVRKERPDGLTRSFIANLEYSIRF